MNRNCHHFNCPADGLCKNGWSYTKGEKWEVDNSIGLECKGTLLCLLLNTVIKYLYMM